MGVSSIWNVPVPGSYGPDTIELFDDFTCSSSAASTTIFGWRSTANTHAVSTTELGGAMVCAPTSNEGNTHTNVAGFAMPARGKRLIFACRFKPADADDTAFWVGLSDAADILPTSGVTSGLAFRKAAAASVNVDVEVTVGGSAVVTDSGVDYANDTYVEVAFDVIGEDKVIFYVNGVKVHQTSTMPAVGTVLKPNIGIAADASLADTLTIDWIRIVQNR